MKEVGLARPLAIFALVSDAEWSLRLYMARDRKSADLGASGAQVARWCDEAGVTPQYFQGLVVGEVRRRGGDSSIPGIIGDPQWKNILIAARAKGVEGLPSERTVQRWSTRDEPSKLQP